MPCMGRYAVYPLAYRTRLRLLCHRPPMGFPRKAKTKCRNARGPIPARGGARSKREHVSKAWAPGLTPWQPAFAAERLAYPLGAAPPRVDLKQASD
jgi:hypothetical protein